MISLAGSTRLACFAREPATTALLLVCLAVFGTLYYLRNEGHLQFLNLVVYDLFLRLLPQDDVRTQRIVLVQVTDQDIEQLGEWPLSDATLATTVQRLNTLGASVIGLDVYRDRPVPPGTAKLEAVLQSHPSVIMINKFGNADTPPIPAPEVMERSGRVGFSDVVLDPGGQVRRGLLFLDDGQTVAASFSLQLALGYLRHHDILPQPGHPDASHLRLGDTTLPPLQPDDGPYAKADAAGYQLLLDYRGGEAPFPTLSLSELLADQLAPDTFSDKIAIVGVAAETVKDRFFTPFSRKFGLSVGIPGVALHAHLSNQLIRSALNGDLPLRSFRPWAQQLWIVLWCVAGAALAQIIRSMPRFMLILFGGLTVLVGGAFGGFVTGWWVPMVTPALAWVAAAALMTAYLSGHERAQRRLLMDLFCRHVSDNVANEIWHNRDHFIRGNRLIPQEVTATVMFTDIERFTAISEALAPEELMDWLNTYMEAMADVIIEHGGVIDDYYGDAIKANFGVPVGHTHKAQIQADAANALRCALRMEAELVKINQLCEQQGMPQLRMRMGICTGNVVAGCLGSAKRMKYTTVGDTVNIAARLESHDKIGFGTNSGETNCRILVAESTWHLVRDICAAEAVGKLPLKGKRETVTVYRVTGYKQEIAS